MNLHDSNLWQSIPHYQLSEENKKFITSKLCEINSLLKKWYTCIPSRKKVKVFRDAILSGNFAFCMEFIPKDKQVDFFDDCCVIRKTKYEKLARLDDKSIEEAVVCGYSKLLYSMISKYQRRNPIGSSFESNFYLYQDSYLKLIDAIYSYSDNQICFSTFVCVVMKNHLFRAYGRKNVLKVPAREKTLLKKFKSIMKNRYVESNEIINSEKCIEMMELSEKDTRYLHKALLRKNTVKPLDVVNDYLIENCDLEVESKRKNICEFVVSNQEPEGTSIDGDFRGKIELGLKHANLSKNEKEVLQFALLTDMKYGWQTQIANKMNLTKMRISQLVKSAFSKIKNYILSNIVS
jgi:RNA polymerase sigma factor (sigma-70 family)